MQIHRCPECGVQLKTNYCDICMRKVPFKATAGKQTFQNAEGSSAHKAEKHPCITFDEPKSKPKTMPRIAAASQRKTKTKPNGKKIKFVAIFMAVISVLSSVFGMVSELIEEDMEPEYNYEAYVVDEEVPQITPTQLYNDGEIIVTADSAGLYYDDYTISLTIQNESKQDITVNSQMLSVNGYMLTCGFAVEVESGQTHQAMLQLYSYELEEMGITEVAEIAFYLNLYDSESYDDIATTELITLKTDIAGDFVQPVDDSGRVLYEDGGVRLVLRGMEFSSYGDCDLEVYLENLSDHTVSVSTDSVWVNGQEASGLLWNTLRPNTRTVDSIYLYDLEELEISEASQLEEVTLELHIEYMEDWYVEETVNETITFTP